MPQLDKGYEVFINWQTLMFCLGIYFVTYVLRMGVEAFIPNVKKKGTRAFHLWSEFFLPVGPFGTGMIIALVAKQFPWPMPIADITSAKVMYGLICGGTSGFVYGRFRAYLRVKTEVKGEKAGAEKAEELPATDPEPVPVTETEK